MALTATVGVPVSLDVWTEAGLDGLDPYESGDPVDAETIPPGLSWVLATRTLDGTPTEAGTWEVALTAQDPFGNASPATAVVNVTGGSGSDPEDPDPEDPDPEGPELDPWELHDGLARALADRVAAFVGQPGNAEVVETAVAQVPVVVEYVRGYTRGRGFTGEAPAGPLRAVIVSGAARLVTNPEQVSHFTVGDYSERPAQLAGWTLAELGILRRYRVVSA